MTKKQMPEPVGEVKVDQLGNTKETISAWHLNPGHYYLITTSQAEAYADARVRGALEEAIIEVMRCKTSGIIRNDTVDKCADAIRALIPATK